MTDEIISRSGQTILYKNYRYSTARTDKFTGNYTGDCTMTHRGWHFRILCLAGILLSALVNVSPAAGQASSDNWTLIGQVGGSAQAVAVQEDTIYAGIGLQLTLLDASTPAVPTLLGSSEPFADFVQDVAVSENLAYVAAGAAGLGIVDVSNPAQPVLTGALDTQGYAEGIAVQGSTVYLADGPYGLRVIDATHPAEPVEIGSAYTLHYIFDVVVAGNYAYLAAGGSGLLVVDITNPGQPVEVRQFDTAGYVYGVAISGSTIYLADAWEGVQIVSIANPASPVKKGNSQTPGWALSVAISGTTLYVGDGANGLRVLNVANSSAPYEVGSCIEDGFSRRLVASGSTVYIADKLNGILIIDAGAPASPQLLGAYSSLTDARRVTVSGDYAYIAAGREGDMYVVDVSDPASPLIVGKFNGGGYAADVAISGNYAILATFMDTPNYLWVADISIPATPLQSAVVPLGSLVPENGAARQLAVQGDYLYVADEFGLRIYDIASPPAIQWVGQIQLDNGDNATVGVAVAGDYAYVADASAGVRVIDISTPSNPFKVGTFLTTGFNSGVAVAGNLLYAGNSGAGVQSVDITDPSNPSEISSFQTPGEVVGVTLFGTQLFTGQGSEGIQVLEVSDPANLIATDKLETPGFAWQAVLVGNLLYVADGQGGLLIFERTAPPPGSELSQATVETDPVEGNAQSETPGAIHSLQPVEVEEENFDLPPAGGDTPLVTSCVVSNKNDSGAGSLRNCLANAVAGTVITFNTTVFPPGSPAIIHLSSPLPDLDDGTVTIDASNAGVILDGGGSVSYGLSVASSYNVVMGLQILHFNSDAIVIGFPSQYNQIGGDHSIGSAPSGQGNVLDGNFNGIRIMFASHNTIEGNFVGTNSDGTAAGEGNLIGIAVSSQATYNLIGGPSEGERNIVGNNGRGIDVASDSAAWNAISGNYVGTDVSGNYAIPNKPDGVVIEVGARNNIVGGTTFAERNVISGNQGTGVVVTDAPTTQNTVIGNYIGVNASGTAALPNEGGISVWTSSFNRVGGTQPGEANLISGNLQSAITIGGLERCDVIVIGNQIGLDAGGDATIPNGSGVTIQSGSQSFIGGLNSAAGNKIEGNEIGVNIYTAGTAFHWIAGNTIIDSTMMGVYINNYASGNFIVNNFIHNNGTGVWISKGNENTLRANSISGNSTAGIMLIDGGNQELASPSITGLSEAGVSGMACANCTVEIFSDGGNQGAFYEGAVVADAAGTFSFQKRLLGANVTATATDTNGNTSSFSAPWAISWEWYKLFLPQTIRN
jgi:hypothetical protein